MMVHAPKHWLAKQALKRTERYQHSVLQHAATYRCLAGERPAGVERLSFYLKTALASLSDWQLIASVVHEGLR